MSDQTSTHNILISKAFEKWADKTWFQVIAVIVIIYILSAPLIGPIIYNQINEKNTSEAVVQTLNERDVKTKENHRVQFERSKQMYAVSKSILKNYLDPTNSDYIFLIEFHNGLENVMSGIQFCRFDVTLEIIRDNIQYINQEKFRDDIVVRYDIFLNPEFEHSTKVFYYDIDSLGKVDKYLEQQLRYLNAKSCAIVNLSDKKDIIIGTLLFISTTNKKINITEVYKCQRELEKIIKNNI